MDILVLLGCMVAGNVIGTLLIRLAGVLHKRNKGGNRERRR